MKKLFSIILGVICIVLIIISPFLIPQEQIKTEKSIILTVWHVDSFEGGKGSRYSFLRNVAIDFNKKNKNVYVLVSNYSLNSIAEALQGGNVPDVISYGNCFLNLDKKVKTIKTSAVDGGEIGKNRFAVSYLRGGYFVIKKGGESNEIILSKSDFTTPEIACLFTNERANSYLLKSPLQAYYYFLNSKNATLIGTQRDVIRLINNGVEFTAQPINEYSDIFQYLSLTSVNSDNEFYAKLFIDYMLSDAVQKKVNGLSMLSVNQKGLAFDNEYLSLLEKDYPNYTFSPFSDKSTFEKACETAIGALKDGKDKLDITCYLKQL